MSHPSSLLISLQRAIADRVSGGMTIFYLDQPPPSHAPDFFSNDYLSLATDHVLTDGFLRRVQAAPHGRLFGSTGSRLGTGNSVECNALENAFNHFFKSSSALLVGSGFNANLAFLATVPQKDDVIVYDELIHASCREGIRLSSRVSYRFAHSSVDSLEECLIGVLQKHPRITRGTSTVFVVVESLYSMDGDFCPLTEIVELVETLVPVGQAHIVVDEAHTSGVCGPNGTGYVSHLGLDDRVHTKVHTFSKAWGFHGAIVLTSPIIRGYLINFAKSIIFSTSIPYTDIYALESCLGVVSSTRGQELRRRLHRLSRYARQALSAALRTVPETILALCHNSDDDDATTMGADHDDHDMLCSPVIPVFTPRAAALAEYLLQKGYAVSPLTRPVVKRPRIRVIVHAGNTEAQIEAFVCELRAWAAEAAMVTTDTWQAVSPGAGTRSGDTTGVGALYMAAARAKL